MPMIHNLSPTSSRMLRNRCYLRHIKLIRRAMGRLGRRGRLFMETGGRNRVQVGWGIQST